MTISIVSPGRAPAALHAAMAEVLRLQFHDSIPKDTSPSGTMMFSRKHARAVIAFLRRHHQAAEPAHLLIHCEAGISRSAASECGVPLSGQFAFLNPWVLGTLLNTADPHYAFD